MAALAGRVRRRMLVTRRMRRRGRWPSSTLSLPLPLVMLLVMAAVVVETVQTTIMLRLAPLLSLCCWHRPHVLAAGGASCCTWIMSHVTFAAAVVSGCVSGQRRWRWSWIAALRGARCDGGGAACDDDHHDCIQHNFISSYGNMNSVIASTQYSCFSQVRLMILQKLRLPQNDEFRLWLLSGETAEVRAIGE